jgi:exosome complex component RRP4
MRELYQENDLISAEVQQINQGDGAVALHTRSSKYGKLEGGQLVIIAPYLVKRLKQHFVALAAPLEVGIILGCNGYVWIGSQSLVSAEVKEEGDGTEGAGPSGEADLQLRERMCRVANAVRALAALGLPVHPPAITEVFNLSGQLRVEIKDMLGPEFLAQVAYREADRRRTEDDAHPMDI